MLPNEIRFDWGMAFSVGFALFWRWLLIGAVPGIALRQFTAQAPLAAFAIQIALSFVGLCLAAKWVFGAGRLGSLKILFMEQIHYQDMAPRE